MIYDVAIVGGGVAGIFCSCILAEQFSSKKVVLIEKNKTLGKKLLLSGAGQCNYTNAESINEMVHHFGDKKNFVKNAMKKWTNEDMIQYFSKMGIESIINENNKVFPKSLDAMTLLKGLLKIIESSVDIKRACEVKNIKQVLIRQERVYEIQTSSQKILSKKVVIACGGCSYPDTGSTGDGYGLAKNLGHHIVPLKPGLTGIEVQNNPFASLRGVAFKEIEIIHFQGQKKVEKKYRGDLLFTPFGLSGPVIINNSRYMEKGDRIVINFIDCTSKEAEKEFMDFVTLNGKMLFSSYMNKMSIPKRLKDLLISLSKIDTDKRISEISKKERATIIQFLTAWPVEIDQLKGFKSAMVTVGGVDTTEVNKKTMMSKINQDLYFIGEVLDVDGDTGGYNIQFAFSSAYVAAVDIGQS